MSVLPQTLRWSDREFYLLDQTKLPQEVIEEKQETVEQVWDSIVQLKVRGAPAIGVAGAYGLLVAIKKKTALNKTDFLKELEAKADFLGSARPTAVNLKWALDRMVKSANAFPGDDSTAMYRYLEEEAAHIHEEDIQLCL